MPRPKGAKNKKVDKVDKVNTSTNEKSGTTTNPPQQTTSGNAPRPAFNYPIPETKEDFLALIQCLKDTGADSVGNLEVKASRL